MGEVLGEFLAVGAAELAAEFELDGVDAVVLVAAVGADGEAAVVAAVFGRFAGRGVVRDDVVAHLRELAQDAVGAGEGAFALFLDEAQDGHAIARAAKDGGGIAGLAVEIDHESIAAEALADLRHVIADLLMVGVVIRLGDKALKGIGGRAVHIQVFAVELRGDEVRLFALHELRELLVHQQGQFISAVITQDGAIGADGGALDDIRGTMRRGDDDGEIAFLVEDEVGALGEKLCGREQQSGES